ncbi:ferritin-like domain-containing protein [Corallococcus exercitus]|uniref:Ferritin-like domain-containing protein n=1 Tax=Corallococcus exercitus TaxID=2316736 RepID=A0A7Y4KHR9_9BACT|nr:ferritin-like domain-containing protein [Corallococcus exercitus]NOK32959.1 ferritin-like domain-containing protein [Corallococcus exercitus]
MNAHRLRRLFSRTLAASLATPLLLSGCQSGAGAKPAAPDAGQAVTASGPAAIDCKGGVPVPGKLTISPAPDFIEVRGMEYRVDRPKGPIVGNPDAAAGIACHSATNKNACLDTLEHLGATHSLNEQCEHLCYGYYLAVTRGDEVAAVDTLQSLRTLLGTIDTAQEAALMAFAAGFNPCSRGFRVGPRGEPPVVTASPKDFEVIGYTGDGCGEGKDILRHTVRVSAAGEVAEVKREIHEKGAPSCMVGRRPVGLLATEAGGCEDARGRYFADVARLEAASIQAFLRLREELALHGADVALQDAALASAVDEVRHADVTSRLARRFGAVPPPPSVADVPPRPLIEVLLDNAVEGCVRETYGALVAHHQALHAEDPEIREAMAVIAEDETRHAGLSWDINAWAAPKLSQAERDTLREARRQALAVLRAEVAVPLDARLTAEAGLPSPAVGLALLGSLEQELWA